MSTAPQVPAVGSLWRDKAITKRLHVVESVSVRGFVVHRRLGTNLTGRPYLKKRVATADFLKSFEPVEEAPRG